MRAAMPPRTAARNALGECFSPQAARANAANTLAAARNAPRSPPRASDPAGSRGRRDRLGESRAREDDARVVAEGHFLSPATVRKNWYIATQIPRTPPANRNQGSDLSRRSSQ